MAKCKVTSANVDDQGAVLQFEGATREELATDVSRFFMQHDYAIEKGEALDGTWGTGNKVMRAIFGAFVRRYTFKVGVTGTGGHLTLTLSKGSGITGGIVGMAKARTEAQRLASAMKDYFA